MGMPQGRGMKKVMDDSKPSECISARSAYLRSEAVLRSRSECLADRRPVAPRSG